MLQGKHSAILSNFIKLPFVIKSFVLSMFDWPLKTGFIVMTLEMLFIEGLSLEVLLNCLHPKYFFVKLTLTNKMKRGFSVCFI